MLEIKEIATLQVKLFGVEYHLAKPRKKQLMAMQEELRTDEGKAKSLDILGRFLVEAGLPEEIVDDLQMEHMNLLVEHLTGAKKN